MTDTTIRRRRYSAALKAQILAQCKQPGMSVARVAMAHGINANIVHKWRRQALAQAAPAAILPMAGFMPIPVTPATSSVSADIRIELRRGPVTVTLSWPISAAAECAQFLRQTLS